MVCEGAGGESRRGRRRSSSAGTGFGREMEKVECRYKKERKFERDQECRAENLKWPIGARDP